MRQVLPLHSFPALSLTARSLSVHSLIRHSSTLLAIVALFLLSSGNLVAQGVTTGGVDGVVTNAAGQPLVGATVTAVHEPSGTTYQTTLSNRRRVHHRGHACRRPLHGDGEPSGHQQEVRSRGYESYSARAPGSRLRSRSRRRSSWRR